MKRIGLAMLALLAASAPPGYVAVEPAPESTWLDEWWERARRRPAPPPPGGMMALDGVNILAYAKAWEANYAPDIIRDDIARSWNGQPTRVQHRAIKRAERELAVRIKAEQAAAQAMGMAL